VRHPALALAVAACQPAKEKPAPIPPAPPGDAPAVVAPLRIEAGDCARIGETFVMARPPAGLVFGTGSGYGVSTRRPPGSPAVLVQAPVTDGGLDAAIVRRHLKLHTPSFLYCYEARLVAKPELAGALAGKLAIGLDGRVTSATVDGVDPEIATCFQQALGAIELPKPTAATNVTVTWQLAPGVLPPNPVPVKPRVIDEKIFSPVKTLSGLEACLREQPVPFGALLIDLAAGAPVVRGVDDTGCIGALAKSAVSERSIRCPVAYGVRPLEDIPSIDVTDNALTWRGTELTSDALVTAMRAVPKKTTGDASLVENGPILVRPLDTAPMKLVLDALTAAAAGGVGVELARRDGSQWRLVRGIVLPLPPVPDRRRPTPAWVLAIENDRMVLTANGAERVIDGHHFDALVLALREAHGKGARTDLRVAVAPDVLFGTVANMLDAAMAAELADWELVAQ
jgi:hypothetical protein